MIKAKFNTIFSVLFLMMIITLTGCAAEVEKSPVNLVDGFVVVDDIFLARAEIEASGGKINHIFFNDNVLIGKIPYGLKSEVYEVYYLGDKIPKNLESVYFAWEKNLEWNAVPISERVFDDSLKPIMNDVVSFEDDFLAKDFSKSEYNALNLDEKAMPYGAFPTDTSLYMIGDVSVSVILPESISGTEDWTAQEISDVHAEIMNGLDWWTFNNPDADLTFVYDWNDQVSVTDEPISYNHIDYWIIQSMESLGYPFSGTYLDQIYDLVNDQRSLKDTDWGFVIFVADSSNDVDGKFVDGWSAFTILNGDGGGPYLVMTYDNNNYGISNMDAVLAHETGHIFGAVDQYGSCSCTDDVGYLNYQNQNCINGCAISEDSIMKSMTGPFVSNLIDLYAKGQIGLVDSDADGILDIVDFEPTITSSFSGRQGDYFSIEGNANSAVYSSLNPYYSDVTINEISNVEYNVDNGSWLNALAVDGSFNGFVEQYDATHEQVLEWGNYLFNVRAVDRFNGITDPLNYVEVTYQSTGCFDSDVEDNLKLKGFVDNYDGVSYGSEEDQCIGRKSLRQYSCSGDDIVYQDSNCAYGCSTGTCLVKKGISYPNIFMVPSPKL
jgi:hypothetical protein